MALRFAASRICVRSLMQCAIESRFACRDRFFHVQTLLPSQYKDSNTRSILRQFSTAQPATATKETRRWTDLDYSEVSTLLESGEILLIDVRDPEEISKKGKIDKSINIPLGQLRDALQLPNDAFKGRFQMEKPPKAATNIVFYGQASHRQPIKSTTAMEIAHKLGFNKARHYVGGYEEWSQLRK